jgi:hypothetical protein
MNVRNPPITWYRLCTSSKSLSFIGSSDSVQVEHFAKVDRLSSELGQVKHQEQVFKTYEGNGKCR